MTWLSTLLSLCSCRVATVRYHSSHRLAQVDHCAPSVAFAVVARQMHARPSLPLAPAAIHRYHPGGPASAWRFTEPPHAQRHEGPSSPWPLPTPLARTGAAHSQFRAFVPLAVRERWSIGRAAGASLGLAMAAPQIHWVGVFLPSPCRRCRSPSSLSGGCWLTPSLRQSRWVITAPIWTTGAAGSFVSLQSLAPSWPCRICSAPKPSGSGCGSASPLGSSFVNSKRGARVFLLATVPAHLPDHF